MQLYQIDYRIPGYFYMLTEYDLDSPDEDDIRETIAKHECVKPEDIELMWDTLKSYIG